jgi:N-acyl amino acid synthase of PEP-CTERM/exosortase system
MDEIVMQPSALNHGKTDLAASVDWQPRDEGQSGPAHIGSPDATARYFTGQVIDDAPQLVADSYSLRYRVYCLERRFLPAEEYPDELEVDEFDRHSVHIGVLNTQGEIVATARLVEPSDAGLPLFNHCSIFPEEPSLDVPERRAVEVSRFCVSRKYNRRAGDGFYSLQGAVHRPDHPERRAGGDIVLALFKALYQASKRRGFTHWLAATEKSVMRVIAKYGLPFREIGPETDYYGMVSPYLMDLQEFDKVISSHRISPLDGFLDGLEAEFRPVEDDTRPSIHAAR